MDALDELDAQDWSQVMAANGPTEEVPGLLRQVLDDDAANRAAALEQLWGTVWHQGTVYECTPLAVPFLVRVATNPTGDDQTRAQVALLLTSVTTATSFVLPGERQMRLPVWLREPGEAAFGRDLAVESRDVVAACAATLAAAVTGAPTATRVCLVAVLAAVSADLTADDLITLGPVEADDDGRVRAAARLVRMLAEGSVNEDAIAIMAATDEDAAGYLASIASWPLRARAVELARELAERVSADQAAS